MNLSAHHFPGKEQTSLQSFCSSWWVIFPSASILHLSWVPGTPRRPEQFKDRSSKFSLLACLQRNTRPSARRDSCHRVMNLPQQYTNVLLRHPEGRGKPKVPRYSLPAGLLKSRRKRHSGQPSTEEGQPFDFTVAPSNPLPGPLPVRLFHSKRGRLTRLQGLGLQVGLPRPGEPPAFGAEDTLRPVWAESISGIPQELREAECVPEAQPLLQLLPRRRASASSPMWRHAFKAQLSPGVLSKLLLQSLNLW